MTKILIMEMPKPEVCRPWNATITKQRPYIQQGRAVSKKIISSIDFYKILLDKYARTIFDKIVIFDFLTSYFIPDK